VLTLTLASGHGNTFLPTYVAIPYVSGVSPPYAIIYSGEEQEYCDVVRCFLNNCDSTERNAAINEGREFDDDIQSGMGEEEAEGHGPVTMLETMAGKRVNAMIRRSEGHKGD
jgi:hypothetical protein